MIGIGCDYYSNVFDALEIVLGPGNHLRSCGSTRAFICAKNDSKHATDDVLYLFHCFEGSRTLEAVSVSGNHLRSCASTRA